MLNNFSTVVKRRQIRKQNCNNPDRLGRKWQQLNYRVDECEATTVGQTETIHTK
jgi:hypothetical protein